MLDADELQRGTSTRLQVFRDAIEIGRPPAFADRFDHFDRCHGIEPF